MLPQAFPATRDFSAFARSTLTDLSPLEDPDAALVAWMEREEALFRRLERRLIAQRLEEGFMDSGEADIDGFIDFSLSVQNRRKSRAGHALGHHIEAILVAHGIRHKREATTEKRAGPDFLFPGETEYHDAGFPSQLLTMLGAKTSCKDRWRQVTREADRIREKHLLTLEPGISEAQTNEMQRCQLQLVLPRAIHSTYRESQQHWLIDVSDFLRLTTERQALIDHG